MLLRFPNNIFLLHLSLETAKGALKRLAFLYYYYRQLLNLLNLLESGKKNAGSLPKSKVSCQACT